MSRAVTCSARDLDTCSARDPDTWSPGDEVTGTSYHCDLTTVTAPGRARGGARLPHFGVRTYCRRFLLVAPSAFRSPDPCFRVLISESQSKLTSPNQLVNDCHTKCDRPPVDTHEHASQVTDCRALVPIPIDNAIGVPIPRKVPLVPSYHRQLPIPNGPRYLLSTR